MDAREENEDAMEGKEEEIDRNEEDIMEMEENNNQDEHKDEEMQDVDTTYETPVSLADDDEVLLLGHDNELDLEKPLREEEIDVLISELVGVESKAAEAQKALEKESLAEVESEVREELAHTLRGVELDESVAAKMMPIRDQREATLDELEIENAKLLEQLDGAGVDLPKLYKMIESQIPNGCYTQAWRKRAHWVGTQATNETVESLANAESFLHTHCPVLKRHGNLLEEGPSGFLENFFGDDGVNECLAGPSELEWSSLNNVFTEKEDESVSFGSKNWDSVYLESPPQQAAAMGLEFSGVNEVEEIEEIDAGFADSFFADEIENEREFALTEEQKKNYSRVEEEDDINIDPQLELCLNRKRRKTRSKQVIRHTAENSDDDSAYLDESPTIPNLAEDQVKCPETSTQFHNNEVNKEEYGNLSNSDVDKLVCITDVNADTMRDDTQNTPSNFKCTACNNVAVEVHTHPLLEVIVCIDCKRSIEDRLAKGGDDSKEEMLHLFEFDEAADSQNTTMKQKVGCNSDKLMENLLQRHNPNWISSFHEHETLLKENEEEKLTKEEKDMAREVYRRAFEWEGVKRVAPELQKPSPSPQTVPQRRLKRFSRSRFVNRKCTRIAHQRTLISQGRKVGSSTVCGECGLVLTWEDVTPASKIDYLKTLQNS